MDDEMWLAHSNRELRGKPYGRALSRTTAEYASMVKGAPAFVVIRHVTWPGNARAHATVSVTCTPAQ
jgi:hypothetical protein